MNLKSDDEDYSVVVAHPDDETLWASSIIANAKQVIICFAGPAPDPALAPARYFLRQRAPSNFVFLDLGVPEVNCGFVLSASSRSKHDFAGNRGLLLAPLGGLIDTKIVYTHNPWGEYGHPDHVLVYEAVRSICNLKGLVLRVFGYFSHKTFVKRLSFLSFNVFQPVGSRSLDADLFCRLRGLYASLGFWTWSTSYVPPAHEYFHELDLRGKKIRASIASGSYILSFDKLKALNGGASVLPNSLTVIFLAFILEGLLSFVWTIANACKRFGGASRDVKWL